MLNKQFQRVRSAAVAAPVKAGACGQSQRFPAWGSDAHGAWSPSHSRVDEVKILGEAGIFTSRHTAFRARHRRAAVPISHTELWGRRRQDTTATNTSVTTRDSLHFKKNLLQNLTSLLFYTYKQSRKCVHTDSFSLQDLKAHRLVRRERSTSPPCLWQITPSLDLRGCKPSVRQNLSVTDISSFRSYSEPRDKCVQKCCTWDWLVTECTLECLQQQSGGLKETCGFLF